MTETAATQVSSFIDKFDDANAALIRACRAAMRKRLITAALAQAKTSMPASGKTRTMVKSISAKQRPRRAVR